MSDEMDESWGSEKNDPTPEEEVSEGVEASDAEAVDGEGVEAEAVETEGSDADATVVEDQTELVSSAEREEESAEPLPGNSVDAASSSEDVEAAEDSTSEPVDDEPVTEALAGPSPHPPAAAVSYPETFQEATPRPDQKGTTSAPPHYATGSSVKSPTNGLDKPGLDLLYDVELDATLQFGSKEMLLRDVLELGAGDVIQLDRHIAEPVDLVVGDRIVARGEVVVASGNFALRVTEVATPQMRLESIRCLF